MRYSSIVSSALLAAEALAFPFPSLFSNGALEARTAKPKSSVIYRGVDISSLPMLEQGLKASYEPNGWQWQVDKHPPKLENLFHHNGVNIVRLRLWYTEDPKNMTAYGLQYTLALAKRLVKANMMIYLDIFYSDNWADPSHNWAPAGWRGYTLPEMQVAVADYTTMVMNTFQDAKVPLEIVSIGNEITKGMLWPLAGNTTTPFFPNLGAILHTASTSIRSSRINPQPKIMVHCDKGDSLEVQTAFYEGVFSNGLDVDDIDVIGGTFYPFYNYYATQGALTNTFTHLSQKYNKPCMVVETNWPLSCPDPGWLTFASDLWGLKPDNSGTGRFNFSADGQRGWMKLVSQSLNAVPNGMGQGLFYWEPAWANNTGLGTPCNDNGMMTWMWGPNAQSESGYSPIGILDSAVDVFKSL